MCTRVTCVLNRDVENRSGYMNAILWMAASRERRSVSGLEVLS